MYFDPDRRFFGPTERRIKWKGYLNPYTYLRIFQTRKTEHNMIGDGALLGAVFVVAGDGRVVYEHRESMDIFCCCYSCCC